MVKSVKNNSFLLYKKLTAVFVHPGKIAEEHKSGAFVPFIHKIKDPIRKVPRKHLVKTVSTTA